MAKVFVLQTLLLFVLVVINEATINTNQLKVYDVYKNVYYDPATNLTLKTEIEDSGRIPFTRIGFRSLPCACQELSCGCCAGINITRIKFDQKACTNFTYDPYEFEIRMDVAMNDRRIFSNKLSAKNPPPICLPIPYIPIMDVCVRFHNVFMPGNNLHACIDFETRLIHSPILVLHFDCVKVGADGIVWTKPEDSIGLKPPEIEQSTPTIAEPETYDEVNFESTDLEINANDTSSGISLTIADEEHIGQLKL